MNILITTLGKGNRNEGGYRETQYQLENSQPSSPTPFIGLALLKTLPKIDKLVVLGTTTSIWDSWWQCLPNLANEESALFDKLEQNVKTAKFDEDALNQLSAILSKELRIVVECKYIPDSFDEKSQLSILHTINAIGNKGDQLHLDVTHGFRHLPMLQLLSAFLKKNEVTISNIYYGAFEKTVNNITPVITLTGLLHIEEWIEAMTILRHTGDVIPLAEIPTMSEFRTDLKDYNFFIQMNNIRNARSCANRIIGLINGNKLPQEGQLFKQELKMIFSWATDQEYAKRQLAQAKEALKCGNILRAIILLNEATISAWVEDKTKILDVDARSDAEDCLFHNGGNTWHLLRRLRNSAAHDGERNNDLEKKIKDLRCNSDKFYTEIKKIVAWVEKQVERANNQQNRKIYVKQ